jgi:adenylate kinase
MKIVVTGQVGLDKQEFLETVRAFARDDGEDIKICNVGEMMYREAPDVAKGRILDLPLSRLNGLRRSVFKDVLSASRQHAHVLINTHATFRWRHGLFYAFDHDQMQELAADLYVCMVDNVDRVQYRLVRDGHVDHRLKDLMVWREEEILATELLSQLVRGHRCFYITARGSDPAACGTAEALYRLIFRKELKTAYLSFPMSHVLDRPKVLAEIEAFRKEMKRFFTCFDPADMEEKYLGDLAIQATQEGHRTIEVGPADQRVTLDAHETLDIIADIDGQIYVRDFKLIDQSDMIISLIPQMEDGRPGLSSGVERELQHAHEATRDVFVVWQPEAAPSPFVTETATRVFRSTQEAIDFFLNSGYVPQPPKGSLFGAGSE